MLRALLAAVVGIGLVIAVLLTVPWAPPAREDALVPADVERDTPVAQGAPLAPGLDLTGWARDTADLVDVPARALAAYGAAEVAQRGLTPACRLSWTTLAGIGRVESDHGTLGRSDLDADGLPRPRIVGVPLDGSEGVREIRDTDGGRLDGDTVYDRAVGPMQFLPTTWERFGADGNGDGVRDPHQIDDAARAAAAYLCAGDRDTADGAGWWEGVLAYNRSGAYARLVWAAADRYATAAATAP
ncbi:lytic murein transglycosylase [Pseudonocardia sp.]|uniref:lytic murein transglycosylase n=1 Tax=Pseudonocardia sp. TaxID=60912 RepID=UPI00260C6AE7|nr:lytic murein transglycosylase [Pseudonocardia sp.]